MSKTKQAACGAIHPMHGVSCQLAEGHAYGLLHRFDDGTGVHHEWQTPDLRIPMQRGAPDSELRTRAPRL